MARRRDRNRMLIRTVRSRSRACAGRRDARTSSSVGPASTIRPGSFSLGEEERAGLRDALRLLHVVRDDHDRDLLPELGDRLLDAAASTSGRARSTARPSAAPAAAPRATARCTAAAADRRRATPPGSPRRFCTSFHRPACGGTARRSRALSARSSRMPESCSPATTFSATVIDGNGFGFWNTMPIRRRTSVGRIAAVVEVAAVEQDLAAERGARDELVHAVEDAQEGRLAAARRADERRDLARRHVERDPFEHLAGAEPRADRARRQSSPRRAPRRRGTAGGRSSVSCGSRSCESLSSEAPAADPADVTGPASADDAGDHEERRARAGSARARRSTPRCTLFGDVLAEQLEHVERQRGLPVRGTGWRCSARSRAS